MKFADAIGSWLAYRAQLVDLAAVRASTHGNQSKVVLQLNKGFGEHDLADLRKSHIDLYAATRLQKCKPVTVAGEMDVLRQFLAWCVDEKLIADRPRLPTVSVPKEETPLPSDEAFAWLLVNLPQRHSRAMEFMMLTGLSPHELERVKQCDWTLSGISIGKRPDFQVKQESRRRVVPLNGSAEAIWLVVSAGVNGQGHPFPSLSATEKAIRRRVGRARKSINDQPPEGTEKITPKTARKWFASKVSNDQPEHVLQRLMGHSPGSKVTREHYVRSTDAQLVGAVQALRA